MFNVYIIIIFIIILIYNYIFLINYNKILLKKQKYKTILNNNKTEIKENTLEKQIIEKKEIDKKENININSYEYIYTIKNNPLERLIHNLPERLINYPTRGYPTDYQLYGIIIRNNTETIFNLYGRQKYPGSSQYEYYIEGKGNNNTNVKIPLKIPGDKELEDNNYIEIPEMDNKYGLFQVKLYKIMEPRYIPYI